MFRFIQNLQGRPREERTFVAFTLAVTVTFFVVLLWVGTFATHTEIVTSETEAETTPGSATGYVEEHATSIDLSPFYILKKEFVSLGELIGGAVTDFSQNTSD